MIRGRLHLKREGGGDEAQGSETQGVEPEYIEVDGADLTGVIKIPGWLRDIGLMAWLIVGVTVFLLGMVWLASLTSVIVIPVIVVAIVAAVLSPVVSWLQHKHVPRALGAALMLLAVVALGAGIMLLIIGGVTGETEQIAGHLDSSKEKITDGLKDLGINPDSATKATKQASSGSSDAVSALLRGVTSSVAKLSSFAFFIAMVVLSLFFLLKDGPLIRHWVEGHLPLPRPVARISTQRILGSLRGYFLGVTIVAAFSSVVVAAGALILGVPMVGTIVLVTFIGGFIPYLGAWTAGAFAVLMSLSAGTDAAIGMVVVQLLANGILQQLVQPFAMGAALGIHPLAVLIVTIAGGALFGGIGLILAAPLTSAALKIIADLQKARKADHADADLATPAPAPATGSP